MEIVQRGPFGEIELAERVVANHKFVDIKVNGELITLDPEEVDRLISNLEIINFSAGLGV